MRQTEELLQAAALTAVSAQQCYRGSRGKPVVLQETREHAAFRAAMSLDSSSSSEPAAVRPLFFGAPSAGA
jgi:hypothetical protein